MQYINFIKQLKRHMIQQQIIAKKPFLHYNLNVILLWINKIRNFLYIYPSHLNEPSSFYFTHQIGETIIGPEQKRTRVWLPARLSGGISAAMLRLGDGNQIRKIKQTQM
jgi:hypothetical protein